MKTWVVNCPDGFTKKVKAERKEMAVKMVMKDPDAMEHMKAKHKDLISKPREELMGMMMGMTSMAQ